MEEEAIYKTRVAEKQNFRKQQEIQKLLEEFAYDMKLANKSPATIYRYRLTMKDYLKFCDELKVTVQEVGRRQMKLYLQSMEKLAPKTVHSRLAAISSFYAWMIREELIDSNPAKLVNKPKVGKRLPQYPSDDEVQKLIQFCRGNKKTFIAVAVEILAESGLRISELVNTRFGDVKEGITKDNRLFYSLNVIGKGDKERQVPISPALKQRIKSLEDELKEQGYTGEFLFPGNKLKGHITDRQMRAHLHNCWTASGQTSYSPHKLRHFTGTHLYKEHGDLYLVAKVLGHSNVQTTTIYSHIDIGSLAERLQMTQSREAKPEEKSTTADNVSTSAKK
ncbi:MAG: tyrosine-type recombinase/integrase [SAR324 cluster bacterium]|nr:tyrosine-type recombinase/integrase [SAR324 cluster bacterium]